MEKRIDWSTYESGCDRDGDKSGKRTDDRAHRGVRDDTVLKKITFILLAIGIAVVEIKPQIITCTEKVLYHFKI